MKKRLALDRRFAARLNAESEGLRERSQHSVDRSAFLRAARQVDAAQPGAIVERRAGEKFSRTSAVTALLKLATCCGKAKIARRRPRSRSACRRSGTRSTRRATRSSNSAAKESWARPDRDSCSGKRHSPYLRTIRLIEIVEILGEAGDQIGLRQQHIHRKPHAQLAIAVPRVAAGSQRHAVRARDR